MLGRKRARDQNVFPAKRRKRFLVEEIKYDPEARQEFLTGFHKRKVQRQKHAQETAALKEKEERKRQKAELRAERQQYVDKHMAVLNGTSHEGEGAERASDNDDAQSPDSPRDGGVLESATIARETEFEDEDITATVTVQAVDVTREGLQPHEDHPDDSESTRKQAQDGARPKAATQRQGSSKGSDKVKRKKKKFRYESKAENKLNRAKERAAGKAKGRASRK